MINKIYHTFKWLPAYARHKLSQMCRSSSCKPEKIYFTICDHFEPYWNNVDRKTACSRIAQWLDQYPSVAMRFTDTLGNHLKYSFFYPIDEYRHDDMEMLAELCRHGFGEVEVHLHHDGDNSDNLRRTLHDYKKCLYEEHGLLSTDKLSGTLSFGFIHGNWALDNSRPDGRWCGVNDELRILEEAGCYADFTLPSAPSSTQTTKINSIYRAQDDPVRPKSHDSGVDVATGINGNGLLMIQGPLALAWHNRKFGIIPRIENSGLHADNPPSRARIKLWIDTAVTISGAEEHVFVKIYTHGTQEKIMSLLFHDGGLDLLFRGMQEYADESGSELHFVSAREMANIVLAIESGSFSGIEDMRDFQHTSNINQ